MSKTFLTHLKHDHHSPRQPFLGDAADERVADGPVSARPVDHVQQARVEGVGQGHHQGHRPDAADDLQRPGQLRRLVRKQRSGTQDTSRMN